VGAGAVRAGDHAHAAIVPRHLVEREPRRDDGWRLQSEIGVVLMPADELAVLRILDPEPRRHDEQVRSGKIGNGTDEARMTCEPPGPVKVEMAFDLDGFDGRATGLRLELFQLPAAPSRLCLRDGAYRRDEPVLLKLADLLFAQHLWHDRLSLVWRV